jgi:general secretion pathway protein C
LAIDALLKRYFLGVVLALVAVAAYFQAAGATQLVGSAISAAASASGSSVVVVPPYKLAVPTREPKSGLPIIERNPFDSVTGPLNAVPPPDPALTPVAGPDTSDPLSSPPCDGMQVLIVTESTDPLWSVAALQGPGEPHPRMRRVGDEIAGKKVAFIGFNPKENTPAVWIEGGSTLCQAMLFRTQPAVAAAPAAAAAAPEAPPPPPKTTGGPPALDPAIAAKIHKVSDTEYNIDRSVVDQILENQAELMKSARIVPEQKDGKVVGVRMFGIRPDTLLGTLGLQNGDRLETLNGFNMASPEKALEAYARLRTASALNVSVNRRGTPVTISLHIK